MAESEAGRALIVEDLRGLVSGDVYGAPVFLWQYASDGGIHEMMPTAVVAPRGTADVAACVQYAAEEGIPIHCRGAGTGLAGGAVGSGIIIDFSKHMRRIVRFDGQTVRVQAGMVWERLNAYLLTRGRHFGPNPGESDLTTLGSIIASNGAGSRFLKYGRPSDHLRGLQVVTADGCTWDLPAGDAADPGEDRSVAADSDTIERRGPGADLLRQLAEILAGHGNTALGESSVQSVDRAGYCLDVVPTDGRRPDLARLITGSEGTLGVITEVQLAVGPAVSHRRVVVLHFDRLDRAVSAVPLLREFEPSACDLFDRRHVAMVREVHPRFERALPADVEAVVLLELEGDDPYQLHDQMDLAARAITKAHAAKAVRTATDEASMDLHEQLGGELGKALHRTRSTARPIPLFPDLAVPVSRLAEFLTAAQNLFKRFELSAAYAGHVGQGHLALQPFMDLGAERDREKLHPLMEEMTEAVLACDGTISSEQVCGLTRSAWLPRQRPDEIAVFRRIKRLFDPKGILNPGKVVPDENGAGDLTKNLRGVFRLRSKRAVSLPDHAAQGAAPAKIDEAPSEEESLRDLWEMQFNWNASASAEIARWCHGCGLCRSRHPSGRACPLFRINPAEVASPRGKINTILGILTGALDLSVLTSNELLQTTETCVHCRQCILECPMGIDTGRLMALAKEAYFAANGLTYADRAMSRMDKWLALASRYAALSRWALASPQMRWVIEKALGIAQSRKLPRVTSRPFLRRAAKRGLTDRRQVEGPKVAYCVDLFANWCDASLAEAVTAVLQHNDVEVYVPARQETAGMNAIAQGDADYAMHVARRNTTILAEAVREGYRIVTSEPAATVCLMMEYAAMFDDEDDARTVAESVTDVCAYLRRMDLEGNLRHDFRTIRSSLGYHQSCLSRLVDPENSGEYLLRLLPGVEVHVMDVGCCGMAGTTGLRRVSYRDSMRAGRRLTQRMRQPDIEAGATECSACKMQMEQGTSKSVIHPVKLLALAYGLLQPDASFLPKKDRRS